MLNWKNSVLSNLSDIIALAKSTLNGPNGDIQVKPIPADTLGFGVSPTIE